MTARLSMALAWIAVSFVLMVQFIQTLPWPPTQGGTGTATPGMSWNDDGGVLVKGTNQLSFNSAGCEDAFTRYIPADGAVTASHAPADADSEPFQNGNRAEDVTDSKRPQARI